MQMRQLKASDTEVRPSHSNHTFGESILSACRISGFIPRKQKSPHQEQASPHDTTFHFKANRKASNRTSPHSLGPQAEQSFQYQ